MRTLRVLIAGKSLRFQFFILRRAETRNFFIYEIKRDTFSVQKSDTRATFITAKFTSIAHSDNIGSLTFNESIFRVNEKGQTLTSQFYSIRPVSVDSVRILIR